jgi:hypothetical protein
MTDHSDDLEGAQASSRGGERPERLAVVAKLRPGSREEAGQILASGAPYWLAEAGFRRHSVFIAEEAVVFIFEGSSIEELVRGLVNNPTSSAAFSAWGPFSKGRPRLRGRRSTGKPAELVGARGASSRASSSGNPSSRFCTTGSTNSGALLSLARNQAARTSFGGGRGSYGERIGRPYLLACCVRSRCR